MSAEPGEMSMMDIISENILILSIYLAYLVIGGLLVLSNSSILMAVAFHPALRRRKEYIMVSALALSDVIHGWALVAASLYRGYLILTQQDNVLVSAWTCLWKAHNMLFLYGNIVSALMLVCVNIDRLVAVTYPMVYFSRLTRGYSLALASRASIWAIFTCSALDISVAFKLKYLGQSRDEIYIRYHEVIRPKQCTTCQITPFYMIPAVLAGVAFMIAYQAPPLEQYREVCMLSYAYDRNPTFAAVFQNVQLGAGLLSVVIFLIVLAILLKKKAPAVTSELQTKRALKEAADQRHITMTIGLSSFFTFMLFCVPGFFKVWFEVYVEQGTFYTIGITLLACVSNCNAIVNFFLYTMRHRDLRFGVNYLLKGRKINEVELKKIMREGKSAKTTTNGQATEN